MKYRQYIRLSEIPFWIYPELNISPVNKTNVDDYLTSLLDGVGGGIADDNPAIATEITYIVTGLMSEINTALIKQKRPEDPSIKLTLNFLELPTPAQLDSVSSISNFEILNYMRATTKSIAQWLLLNEKTEEAKAFDNSIKTKMPESGTFQKISHTSELIEVMKHTVIEHWEGLSEHEDKPKNSVVEAWILEQYPNVSRSMAKNIASIIRPDKYK